MKFSLLYKNEEYTDGMSALGEKLNYDLSLDKTVSRFCDNARKKDYFLSVLRHPLKDTENIAYRTEILNDFLDNSALLPELKQLFTHYDNIKSDWQSMKPVANTQNIQGNFNAAAEYAYSSLKVAINYLRTVSTYLKFIIEALGHYELRSEALRAIYERCAELNGGDGLKEALEISDLFYAQNVDEYDFDIVSELDESMRLAYCKLSSVRPAPKSNKNILSSLIHKRQKTVEGSVILPNTAEDEAQLARCTAISSIAAVFDSVASEIYDSFYGFSKELVFYEVSLLYIKYIKESQMPMCTAEMLPQEADTVKLCGLRDPYLLGEVDNGTLIRPNDAELVPNKSGMLIRGSNGSGKTVFLRSIGTAQIFAQAGLPICAESAVLSIRTAIFSQFSSSEKDFKPGDNAGRFEGEVKEISDILDSALPHSLLLLNETFQTTVYSEGAEGIFNILKILPKLKMQYIFVSHLGDLYGLMEGSDVLMLKTDDSFNVKPV